MLIVEKAWPSIKFLLVYCSVYFYFITTKLFYKIIYIYIHFGSIFSNFYKGGRGHWAVDYTSPNSFIITFSYSLSWQLWGLKCHWLYHWVECPNVSITNCNIQKCWICVSLSIMLVILVLFMDLIVFFLRWYLPMETGFWRSYLGAYLEQPGRTGQTCII